MGHSQEAIGSGDRGIDRLGFWFHGSPEPVNERGLKWYWVSHEDKGNYCYMPWKVPSPLTASNHNHLLRTQGSPSTPASVGTRANSSITSYDNYNNQQTPRWPGMYSWQDPQVYSNSLNLGASNYLDITDQLVKCHRVKGSVQGRWGLNYKSGPAKPKLESLSISQWSTANLAIINPSTVGCRFIDDPDKTLAVPVVDKVGAAMFSVQCQSSIYRLYTYDVLYRILTNEIKGIHSFRCYLLKIDIFIFSLTIWLVC